MRRVNPVCIGVMMRKIAKPAKALGPKLTKRMAKQIINRTGAAQPAWKRLQAKSIRETSVEMWLTSLPSGWICRARVESVRDLL